MSSQGFRECKQSLWSLFQSYSFVEVATSAKMGKTSNSDVGLRDDEDDLVMKVVREPEFRSVMAAFVHRANFERFFAVADSTDSDDVLGIERALSRLSSEATLVKLWADMARTRARLRRGRPASVNSPIGTPDADGTGEVDSDEDSLEVLSHCIRHTGRGDSGRQAVRACDVEVSPSVTVNWVILSSVLFIYMHDSLRLRAVDEATARKARAAIRANVKSTSDADPIVRMSIAVDADSYAPVAATTDARPLAQPEKLRHKVDRTPLYALHRMLSTRHSSRVDAARSPLVATTPAREDSVCSGRKTIEIPVEDEEEDEEEVEKEGGGSDKENAFEPCTRGGAVGKRSPSVTTAVVDRPGAGAGGVTLCANAVPSTASIVESPAAATSLKTRQQRQEERLRQLATPKRMRERLATAGPAAHDSGALEGTPPRPRPTSPQMMRSCAQAEPEPLPSPSKLCSSGGASLSGAVDVAKPVPPPLRKYTQKEAATAAAAAAAAARLCAADTPDGAVHETARLHEVAARLNQRPPARSPSPAFPPPLHDTSTGCEAGDGEHDWEGQRRTLRDACSPPPREPVRQPVATKHAAYISASDVLSGPLRQPRTEEAAALRDRGPSEANRSRAGGVRKEGRHDASFVIRTRGRTGTSALASRQPRPGPDWTPLPVPTPPPSVEPAPPLPSNTPTKMEDAEEEEEERGRGTTALSVEPSDLRTQRPLLGEEGERGDFDVDTLTAKPHQRPEEHAAAPPSPSLPPTALSRARQRNASPLRHHHQEQQQHQTTTMPPLRVATAPSVSLSPCERSGRAARRDLFASQQPPTTRESSLLRSAGPPPDGASEQLSRRAAREDGAQNVGPAEVAHAPAAAARSADEGCTREVERRLCRLADSARESPLTPYPEPPELQTTVFLRATPFSAHPSRIDVSRSRARHAPLALADVSAVDPEEAAADEALLQRTPPKQKYRRRSGDEDEDEGSREPSIRVTPGHPEARSNAAAHCYTLHNLTASSFTDATSRTPARQEQRQPLHPLDASPASHASSSPPKAATPRRSCHSLLPPSWPAQASLPLTPRSVGSGTPAAGASSPPPRLSARARRLSRSASRGRRRADGGAASEGDCHMGPQTPPRVPLTRCRSGSSLGGDANRYVAVLVSPRRTCGGAVGALLTSAATTPTAASPSPPPSALGARVSRQPLPLSPGKGDGRPRRI